MTTSQPAPLFDLVTGFPPDDALDVTLPVPLSLAIHMTMLESTGHAAELATLRRVHLDAARAATRSLQALADDLTAPDVPAEPRLRVTQVIEERVRGVNGLRPHVHLFVGTTVRCAGDRVAPLDVDALVSRARTEVLPDHLAGLVAATTQRCGLVWGPTPWSSQEVLEPPWLVERAARARGEEIPCPGPWPRRQVLTGWEDPGGG